MKIIEATEELMLEASKLSMSICANTTQNIEAMKTYAQLANLYLDLRKEFPNEIFRLCR